MSQSPLILTDEDFSKKGFIKHDNGKQYTSYRKSYTNCGFEFIYTIYGDITFRYIYLIDERGEHFNDLVARFLILKKSDLNLILKRAVPYVNGMNFIKQERQKVS